MIIIRHYDPAWPAEFEALRSSLTEILGPLALRIDHIGSTSVPGLGAKDVIDAQVTVRELAAEIRRKLVAAGFEWREAITHDHVPLGADARPEMWSKLVFAEPKGRRRANVHVRVAGHPNQRYPLLFRDYLRAHPGSARSLELIKREIARRHADDVEAYYDIKDPVCDLIWDAAQEWARQTGWEPE
ncbi:MAG: GrpB family protein [bacterium]